jgi:hypothetical protein
MIHSEIIKSGFPSWVAAYFTANNREHRKSFWFCKLLNQSRGIKLLHVADVPVTSSTKPVPSVPSINLRTSGAPPIVSQIFSKSSLESAKPV